MFKIQINITSNIKFNNSKANLYSLQKRLIFFKFIFFKILKIKNFFFIKYYFKKIIFNKKLVLIKAPFHYKISKTILNSPKNNFIITLNFNNIKIKPIFYNKKIYNIFNKFNNIKSIQINSIKITHNVKFL